MLATKNWARHPTLAVMFVSLLLLGTSCAPPGVRALLDGERLVRQRQYEQAIQRLTVAARLLGTNAQAFNHLGLAYHGAGKAGLAIKAYQQALTLDPNLAAANFNLGCLYLEQGNAPAAVSVLTTFTLQWPRSVDGKLKLATALFQVRAFDTAERVYTEARQLQPKSAEILNGLGMAQVQRRRYQDARASFTEALSVQSNYGPAVLNLATLSYLHLNQRQAALEKYRDYLALTNAEYRAEVTNLVARLEAELRPTPVPSPRPDLSNVSNLITRLSRLTNAPSAPAATNTLAAKPVAATNIATTVVSPPPAASAAPRTNAAPPAPVRPAPVVRSEPPDAPAPTNPPPTTAAAKPAAPAAQPSTPVGVVQVAEEPVVATAQDAASSTPSVPALPSSPPATKTGPETEPTATSNATATAMSVETLGGKPGEPDEKKSRGLLSRLDPRSWFTRRPKSATSLPASSAPATAPTPAASQPAPAPAPTTPAPAPEPAPAPAQRADRESTPLPPRPRIPRYAYLSLGVPPAGNRNEALRSFRSGYEAQQKGDWPAALKSYAASVAADPSLYEAQYNLGLAAFHEGQLTQSLSAYEHALALNAESVSARYNFALALQKGGFGVDAAEELEKVVQQQPNETKAHFTLAGIYANQLYQRDRARSHYLKVLELQPQHPQSTAIRFWLAENP